MSTWAECPRLAVFLAAVISGESPALDAGLVRGYVRDHAKMANPDKAGIGGIEVTLLDEQGKLLPTGKKWTDAAGHYEFEGVPKGPVKVRIVAVGYFDEETVRQGTSSDMAWEVETVKLVQVTDDQAYMAALAEVTKADSAVLGDVAYLQTWTTLDHPVFSVAARVAFAQSLTLKTPQGAKSLKNLSPYAEADYLSVLAAEKTVMGAMLNTAAVPARSTFKVSDDLLGEIVARRLFDRSIPESSKAKWKGELPETWDKSVKLKIDTSLKYFPIRATSHPDVIRKVPGKESDR